MLQWPICSFLARHTSQSCSLLLKVSAVSTVVRLKCSVCMTWVLEPVLWTIRSRVITNPTTLLRYRNFSGGPTFGFKIYIPLQFTDILFDLKQLLGMSWIAASKIHIERLPKGLCHRQWPLLLAGLLSHCTQSHNGIAERATPVSSPKLEHRRGCTCRYRKSEVGNMVLELFPLKFGRLESRSKQGTFHCHDSPKKKNSDEMLNCTEQIFYSNAALK